MASVFNDKNIVPSDMDLKEVLKDTYELWGEIKKYTFSLFPSATEEWKHSGAKFGWGFRISDKKRVLVYLLPRDGFFLVAFVFGQKATDHVLSSDISDNIKAEFSAAKVFAEGRGIRLEVSEKEILKDIKKLILIKITN